MRPANHLVAFMELLNDELALGATAAAALLGESTSQRASLLAVHPEWLRTGTFDALLAAARTEMNNNVLRAETITQFVLDHVARAQQQPGGEILYTLVTGTAHKDHASALYRRGPGFLDAALMHAEEALRIFATRPALFLECANARFVQAQIFQALGQFTAALAVLDECEQVFAENGDAFRYLHVLTQRGFCHFQLAERANGGAVMASYHAARAAFESALAEAERIGAEEERARLLNDLGHTLLQLHDPLRAQSYFAQAVRACTTMGMTADVLRALWGIAELEAEHGEREHARARLEKVHAEFVHRGMLGDAALVRFDLTIRLADKLQDPHMAHETCAELVHDPALAELPPEVRAAITYLGGSDTPTLDDLAYAANFLRRYENDAAATFERPSA